MKKAYHFFSHLHVPTGRNSFTRGAWLLLLMSIVLVARSQEIAQKNEEIEISNRKANERTITISSSLNGSHVSSYTEVGNGLTYQDELGEWQDSEDLIEIMDDGTAAALKGPNKIQFGANLNTSDPITITTQSNRVFRTRILGLYYFDAASGESVLVAPVQNCSGVLLPPNQILYENAFKGLRADVRMTYTRGAFENDVILLEKPLPPEDYGLSPTSRLEIWHEFKSPTAPKKFPRVLKSETDPEIRAQMKEPDLVDHALHFGDLWFPLGRGFYSDGAANPASGQPAKIRLANQATDTNALFVAKQWIHFDETSTDLLIESVNWSDLAPKLQSLPQVRRVASALELKRRVTNAGSVTFFL